MMGLKHLLAEAGCKLKLARAARVCARIGLMPYLRSVNYHATPEKTRNSFCEHLGYFAKNFENIDEQRLGLFFDGRLPLNRPGMIIGFDDGYADNHDVAAVELDRVGMTGWFYVVAGKVGKADDAGRPFMTWDQIRDLHRQGHVIGSHTWSHERLGSVAGARLEKQVVESKKALEHELSAEVTSFCFPFGDDGSYGAEAISLAARHYRYLFTSCPGPIRSANDRHNIGRAHVESDWELSSVEFVTSGLFDWKYRGRKRRYKRFVESLRQG